MKKLIVAALVAIAVAVGAYFGVPEDKQKTMAEALTVLLTVVGGLI